CAPCAGRGFRDRPGRTLSCETENSWTKFQYLHNIGAKFLLQTNRDHHSPGGIVETQDATQLNARRAAAVTRGIASATPEFAVRAQNAEVWDSVGRRYVDFAGGIGVLATGHRHPKVIAAVSAQLERFTHTAFQVMAYESYIRLAERLN